MSNETLFRRASLNSISSPDQLNDYIKVASPSVWLVLAALFVLLGAVLIWGVTGSLPTTISTGGVVLDGQLVCYVGTDAAGAVEAGQPVSITGRDGAAFKGEIADIGEAPMSDAEIASELDSAYLAYELVSEAFAVKLTIAADTSSMAEGALLDVRIVTDTVRPIDFLLGR